MLGKVYKGLSLDGGGLYGVGQAAILSQCIDLDKFSFISGTSIGAINACLVASKMDKARFTDFFKNDGPKVFAGHAWRKYNPITPKYNDKELNIVLRKYFPGKFGDLQKHVFITAYHLDQNKLKVFYSKDKADAEWPLWEVIRSAVAAETYFLPWKGYADAGIVANVPSMVGIVGMISKTNINLSQLEMFSIGTGKSNENNNIGSTNNWTIVKWGITILDMLLNGGVNSMHEYCTSSILPKSAYKRIQFDRADYGSFDDPAVVDKALVAWEPEIKKAVVDINKF